jgi:hypothetical protein
MIRNGKVLRAGINIYFSNGNRELLNNIPIIRLIVNEEKKTNYQINSYVRTFGVPLALNHVDV